jgi:hypothetical protein
MAFQLSDDTVLVACPTYRGKAYALGAYIEAYNAFQWPYRGLFMVDNTGDGLGFYEHMKSLGVPCDHIDPARDWQETLAKCWRRIVREAVEKKYHWVMSIEADNICPSMTLDVLLNIAGYYKKAVHVAHSYPWHGEPDMREHADKQNGRYSQGLLIGLGCNLILTELLVKIFERERWLTDAVEAEIYEYPKVNGYPTAELHNVLEIRHLDAEHGEEFFQFDRDPAPRFAYGTTTERKPPVFKVVPPNGN